MHFFNYFFYIRISDIHFLVVILSYVNHQIQLASKQILFDL